MNWLANGNSGQGPSIVAKRECRADDGAAEDLARPACSAIHANEEIGDKPDDRPIAALDPRVEIEIDVGSSGRVGQLAMYFSATIDRHRVPVGEAVDC